MKPKSGSWKEGKKLINPRKTDKNKKRRYRLHLNMVPTKERMKILASQRFGAKKHRSPCLKKIIWKSFTGFSVVA